MAADGTSRTEPRNPRPVADRRPGSVPWTYIAGWAVAGVSAVAASLVWRGGPTWSATAVVLLALTAAAEVVEVRFAAERTDTSFTLLEVAVVANLLLLPASTALVVTLLGVTLAQAARRRHLVKLGFNLAQVAVATSVALHLLHGFALEVNPTHPSVVVPLLVGMLTYAGVTMVATAGLLARLGGGSWREAAEEHAPGIVGVVVGNTAVGAVAAALAVTLPHLVILLVAPAAAMHLSSRGAIRTRTLLDEVSAEHTRLERVVNRASDGIALLDAEGTVELWNPAMERITGVPAARMLGRDPARLPDAALRGAASLGVPASGEDEDQDCELVRADGSAVSVSSTHRVIRDANGDVAGDVVVVHDVTRQREVERLKSDFLARVSHELRTPLTPIKGLATTLAARGDRMSPERRTEALELMVERADHLAALIDELLLVATFTTSGGPEVHPAAADVTALVAELTHQVHGDRDVRLVAPAELPAVLTDEAHVREILGHLLDNAVRYSPDGTPVDVVLRLDGGTVAIDVADQGPGIPVDKREEIFEAFQRLEDPLRMRTGGVGLGLHLARRLAHAIGGTVELADRLGRGSVFTLRLPVAASEHGTHDAPVAAPVLAAM